MKNTAIIIPTRLEAKRFPNKPLAKIKDIPMIIHTLKRAKESKVGEVFVATPDNEIINIVKENGGNAFLTSNSHLSGSDRVYEVYSKILKGKADLIVNLQGDMPNINPNAILKLVKLMRENKCDIGTLASNLSNEEINDPNVVKVHVDEELSEKKFLNAKDFFRKKKDLKTHRIYHHIGIYAFTSHALTKYVNLSRSKFEIERNLEQMRAMENNMVVKVGYCDTSPLSVDTEKDLEKIIQEMN